MRPVAARQGPAAGRWVWGLSGAVTLAVLAILGGLFAARAGTTPDGALSAMPSHVITVPQPVTSLDVRSYGAEIRVTTGPGRLTRIAETITYSSRDAGPPAVTETVSGGRLTLAAPACASSGCEVGFDVTVPAGVTVAAASQGGPVLVAGVAAASVDSGGGQVRAAGIRGPLTARTDGGPLLLDGVAGPLRADTGGAQLLARDVAAATAAVTTEGGGAGIEFTVPPRAVTVRTDGGPALLVVPGGPYALSTDSGGGQQFVGIAANPAAHRSITVTSGGGPLEIQPAGGPALVPPIPRLAPDSPLPAGQP